MYEDSNKISQKIEKEIKIIQENIRAKNYSHLSHLASNLSLLILNYILALDYEIKNQNKTITNFPQIKELININLQRISEYLKNRDENLIDEVDKSITQIYNLLFQPQNIETVDWNDIDDQKFFNLMNQIYELSNKVYLYYTKKQIPKGEIIELSRNILLNIEKLP
ncbi:MAG: hypothetical protein RMJ51_05920 [Candidatus Calescibacterium sp.]|nr:hypothetical protein [Candidatus Calescibacterium sp.]MDW8195755.1 hypothetical protein [Candidatus Calescibacterium sp.]